jgi:hypothetical protein
MSLSFLKLTDYYKITWKQFRQYILLSASIILTAKLAAVSMVGLKYGIDHVTLSRNEIIETVLYCINIIFLGLYVKNNSISRLIILVSCSAAITLFSFFYINFKGEENPGLFDKYTLREGSVYSESKFNHRSDANSEYLNLSMLKNTPSVVTKHSITNKKINDLRILISSSLTSPEVLLTRNRLAFDALMSVKLYDDYHDDSNDNYEDMTPLDDSAIEPINSTELFTRYKFKYYIPMGFCYDSYVTHDEFNNYLATCPKDSVMPLLENLVIEPEDVKTLSKHMRHAKINPNATLDSLTQERRKYCATSFVGDTRGCKLTTNFDEERVMFLSVVADPGFTATIDGVKTRIYTANLGLSAIVVPKGKHYIDLDYETPGLKLGCIISLCALLLLLIIAYAEQKR